MLSTNLTQHAAKRLQQRGIPENVLSLLLEYGKHEYDHRGKRTLYFDKRARQQVSKSVSGDELKQLGKVFGTYAVLDDNDCVVTVGHRTQRINRH